MGASYPQNLWISVWMKWQRREVNPFKKLSFPLWLKISHVFSPYVVNGLRTCP